MTTVTLDLPDELAQRLQQIDGETLIILLQRILPPPQTADEFWTEDDDKTDLQDEDSEDREFVMLPPLIPEGDFELVPPKTLPEPKARTISKEEWRKKLLAMPPLDEDSIREMEQAREYINVWNRRDLF